MENKQGKFFAIEALKKVQIYAQKGTKIAYVWRPGSARTCWGSLSASPDPLAAIKGFYF